MYADGKGNNSANKLTIANNYFRECEHRSVNPKLKWRRSRKRRKHEVEKSRMLLFEDCWQPVKSLVRRARPASPFVKELAHLTIKSLPPNCACLPRSSVIAPCQSDTSVSSTQAAFTDSHPHALDANDINLSQAAAHQYLHVLIEPEMRVPHLHLLWCEKKK